MSHTKTGRKCHIDAEGQLSATGKKMSLHHLLSNCTAFLQEKSDLVHLCGDISTTTSTVTVTFTPKFHCEIVGEGIEYAWGAGQKIRPTHPLH
mmetsp:Transcript_547/g.597  ORF Transcript_547/g.597 Transcript_547/m.597 type:complete len:93 (+) Transcript_547:55-333(+)